MARHLWVSVPAEEDPSGRRLWPATVEGACSITDADTGEVTYTWAAGDTASSGTYDLEFEITWADGGVETVPSSGYETVVIEDDLG